jgi:hypothetical protein
LLYCIAALGLPTVGTARVGINTRGTPQPPPSPTSSQSPVWTHQEVIVSAVALAPTSVSVEDRTVSDKGKVLNKTSKTYLVSQFTEIMVNGQRAAISDLKPGMKAAVTIGMDPRSAARIVANE